MTQQFQIGDIVRINEPTADDIVAVHQVGYSYTYTLKHSVGRLAVVTSLEAGKYTKVRLVLCDENYTFDKRDTYRLYWAGGIYTVDSHLSLVCRSILRTHVISDASGHPSTGNPLPLVGSQIPDDILLSDGRTVNAGSYVRELQICDECFRIVFHQEDGLSVTCAPHVDRIVESPPTFTTF